MDIAITSYNAICNLGNNIGEIFEKAIRGDTSNFTISDKIFFQKEARLGIIKTELPQIDENDFNIRANQLSLFVLNLMEKDITKVINKYGKDRIGVIAASTNSGVEEFEKSNNPNHYKLGNPAYFVHKYLNLENIYTTVSTACSSGIKSFSLAKDYLENNISDAIIVVCTDAITKFPIFGFDSLEILSQSISIPLSKNREGMNLGEGCAVFILEKEQSSGIKLLGIGETSDINHPTTPDPNGIESSNAIKEALKQANIAPDEVDYINLHGTGTIANDIMETKALYRVFGNNCPPASSTKQLTGHCLGAAAGIETALCCKLLDKFNGKFYPHIYNNNYDEKLPPINISTLNKNYKKCKICMNNSFGFGGTNAILIIGKYDEKE